MHFIIALTITGLVLPGILNGQTEKQNTLTSNNQTIKIRVKIADGTSGPVYMVRHEYYSTKYFPDKIDTAIKDIYGNYSFEYTDVKNPIYLSFYKEFREVYYPNFILDDYLAEPGDSIQINISYKDLQKKSDQNSLNSNLDIGFIGRGSTKYKLRNQLDNRILMDSSPRRILDIDGNFIKKTYYDKMEESVWEALFGYKTKITQSAYNIMLVDFFVKIESERLRQISIYLQSQRSDSLTVSKIMSSYNKIVAKQESRFFNIGRTISAKYPNFIVEKASIGKSFGLSGENTIWKMYLNLKSQYNGELKDRILLTAAFSFANRQYGQEIINDALATVERSVYFDELNAFAAYNSVGKIAYNFKLPNMDGEMITLDSFRGKVVIIDFWFKGCSGCAAFYKYTLSKVEEEFRENQNVVFITINVDFDKSVWMDAVKKGIYTSARAVNLYTDGLGPNHSVIQKYHVSEYPYPLLIDKQGKILSTNVSDLRGANKRISALINDAVNSK